MKETKIPESILSKLSPEEVSQISEILTQKDVIIAQKDSRIEELEKENLHLSELLRARTKERFCISSEQSGEQLSLFNDADLINKIDELEEVCEKENVLPEKMKKERAKRVTKAVDMNLPVVVEHVESKDPTLTDIHSDHIVRKIARIPAKYFILETHYHKYRTQDGRIVLHGYEEGAFGKSMADSTLVSDIAYQRYVMSTPLYRIEQDAARNGIVMPRQDQARWLAVGKRIFSPVLELIDSYMLSCDILRSDETPFNVLEERSGKAVIGKATSYVWALSTGRGFHPAFHYLEGDRSRETLLSFLKPTVKKMYLQSDCYGAYRNIGGTENVYCLTHIRRGFFKCISKDTAKDHLAKRAVTLIDRMYHEEKLIQEGHEGEYATILALRKEKVKPIYDLLKALVEQEGVKCSAKTQLGKAVEYFSNAHSGFEKVFEDGRLDLDNNYSEREAIKPFVIGRKNSLFAITHDGADVTCAYYSLARTALANKLNPYEYMVYLFDSLPYKKDEKFDYSSYLPWAEGIGKRIEEHMRKRLPNP